MFVHMQARLLEAAVTVPKARDDCRERGRSGSTSGGLGGAGGGGQSEIQLQRQRVVARRKALQRKLSEVRQLATLTASAVSASEADVP